MHLIVVESPTKAKTISGYLKDLGNYTVLSSSGHIWNLDKKSGSVDPEKNFKMKYIQDPKSKKNLSQIIDAAKRADKILLASDPDREGEAISWAVREEILKKYNSKDKIKRIFFTEITKSAILDAIQNPQDVNMDLVEAQQSRASIDYLFGYTVSPQLWRRISGAKSAGRVQSPALKMIYKREEEIRKFIPKKYYTISCYVDKQKDLELKVSKFKEKKLKNYEFNKLKDAEEALGYIKKAPDIESVDVSGSASKVNPKPPFSTSSLQQDAISKLGMSSKRVMRVAQELYEGVTFDGQTKGLITYMRTDSTNMSTSAIDKIRKLVIDLHGKNFIPPQKRIYQTKIKNAQEAHECIRPSDPSILPQRIKNKVSTEQYNLYKLIWSRSVASQMSSAERLTTTVSMEICSGSIGLKTAFSRISFKGFMAVYDMDDSGLKEVNFDKNSKLKVVDSKINHHTTNPPSKLNEATLIKSLEKEGIGRPSTYSTIISNIVSRGYVKQEKKAFTITPTGVAVIGFLEYYFQSYVDYGFTAKMESLLDSVANGEANKIKVLEDFWKHLDSSVKSFGSESVGEISKNITSKINEYLFADEKSAKYKECSKCGGKMQLVTSGSIFIGCSNHPDCTNTIGIESFLCGFEKKEGGVLCSIDDSTKCNGEIKIGKYGPYIEITMQDGSKKNIKYIHDLDDAESLVLKYVQMCFNTVGVYEGYDIKINIGPFGPYLLHNKSFYSIKKPEMFDISESRAIEIIESTRQKRKDSTRQIDYNGETINVTKSRFGLSFTWKKKKFYLKKDLSEVDSEDIDKCINSQNSSKKKTKKPTKAIKKSKK